MQMQKACFYAEDRNAYLRNLFINIASLDKGYVNINPSYTSNCSAAAFQVEVHIELGLLQETLKN